MKTVEIGDATLDRGDALDLEPWRSRHSLDAMVQERQEQVDDTPALGRRPWEATDFAYPGARIKQNGPGFRPDQQGDYS